MKVEDVRRMKSTEMRILLMICGKTVRDKIRNEEVREGQRWKASKSI